MGFDSKWAWVLLSVLLLGTKVSLADTTSRDLLRTTVLVINSARVTRAVVLQAERDSARIFLSAGIEIEWLNCGPGRSEVSCPELEGANEFVLHIVPRATTFTDSVFGVAFLGEDGRGRYGDVFFDGIAAMKTQSEVGDWQLLGSVMTHELGHLLLGSNSHAPVGIMMPVWNQNSLRRIGMGLLFFSPEESSHIRARVRSEMLSDGNSESVVANRKEPYLLFLGGLQ